MAIVVGSGSALSVAANSKSADQITGVHQFVDAGKLQLIAKASATGLNVTLNVASVPLVDDKVIIFTGPAGTISVADNIVVEQNIAGGRVELTFRNTTAAAITVDWILYYTP